MKNSNTKLRLVHKQLLSTCQNHHTDVSVRHFYYLLSFSRSTHYYVCGNNLSRSLADERTKARNRLIQDFGSKLPTVLIIFIMHIVPPKYIVYCTSSKCDLNLFFSFQWLMVVSLAVLYNIIFVLGRAVFWELNNAIPPLWWTLDYVCDAIYILDTLIRAHEGM